MAVEHGPQKQIQTLRKDLSATNLHGGIQARAYLELTGTCLVGNRGHGVDDGGDDGDEAPRQDDGN